MCVCTSVQPCYASHVIVSICPWVSDINAVRPGTSQVPSPYRTNKSWFVYSLVDLVSLVLSKIPSLPLSQSCIHWTPLWNYLLSAAFGTDWMAVSWKCKKTNIKFQIPVEQDMLASFDWYFWFSVLFILSPLLIFWCTFVDNLLFISNMNAQHDWQNLVFVPDNCCLLLAGLEWRPDLFRFTACRCVLATGRCGAAAVPFWINAWRICGSYWLFFQTSVGSRGHGKIKHCCFTWQLVTTVTDSLQ